MRFLVLLFLLFFISCSSPVPSLNTESAIEHEGETNPLTGLYVETSKITAMMVPDPTDAKDASLFFEIPAADKPVYLACWSAESPSPTAHRRFPSALCQNLAQGFEENPSGYHWKFCPPDYETAWDGTCDVIETESGRIFYYDSESGTYSCSDLPGLRWNNLFFLETDMYYDQKRSWNMRTEGGTGYYFSRGCYQELRWQKITDQGPLLLRDTEGADLYIGTGTSYFTFIQYDALIGF